MKRGLTTIFVVVGLGVEDKTDGPLEVGQLDRHP